MSLHIQYKCMSWAALPKEVIWLIKSIHSDPKRLKNHGVLRIGESKKYFFKHKISTRLLRTWYERAFRMESGTVLKLLQFLNQALVCGPL